MNKETGDRDKMTRKKRQKRGGNKRGKKMQYISKREKRGREINKLQGNDRARNGIKR